MTPSEFRRELKRLVESERIDCTGIACVECALNTSQRRCILADIDDLKPDYKFTAVIDGKNYGVIEFGLPKAGQSFISSGGYVSKTLTDFKGMQRFIVEEIK